MRIPTLTRFSLAGFLLLFLSATVPGQSPGPAQQQYRINKIDFEGLRKVPKDRALEASKLKLDQEVDLFALRSAANRLHDTGWFNRVTYRQRGLTGLVMHTFLKGDDVISQNEHVFKISGGSFPICSVQLTGASIAAAAGSGFPSNQILRKGRLM